jgi:glucose/mannose-6-phosphate isomerase
MKLDTQNMASSINVLSKQCLDAWQAMKKIKIPSSYKKIDKIVLFGMGGSLLGIDVVRNLFSEQLKVPVLIVNDYKIPAYVDTKTLAILSSYSGFTEETLAAAQTIKSRTNKIFIITTGGPLARYAQQNKLPIYLINPQYNPCGQPRMAVGYSIMAQLGLYKKLGLIRFEEKNIREIINFLEKNKKQLEQKAKKLTYKIKNKIPIFVASEFLLGNAHIIANQTNENGKNIAAWFAIPELNHHLMEGLRYPKANQKNLIFVFLNSKLYHPRNQKRYRITEDVLKKNRIIHIEFKPQAKEKFLQSFEALQWGSYLSYYLALANKIDPSPIPWVDYFKHALKK